MKPSILLGLCLLPGCLLAAEPQEKSTTAAPHHHPAAQATSTHVMVRASETKWGAGPAALPSGAQSAVLSGDPGKAGPFVLRLKVPAGYRVPRHWHPSDEYVTVIEGDVTFSMGKAAEAHTGDFGAGDYMLLPAKMLHEVTTRNGAVVQVQSTGPFQINYDNPADDPRKKTAEHKGDHKH